MKLSIYQKIWYLNDKIQDFRITDLDSCVIYNFNLFSSILRKILIFEAQGCTKNNQWKISSNNAVQLITLKCLFHNYKAISDELIFPLLDFFSSLLRVIKFIWETVNKLGNIKQKTYLWLITLTYSEKMDHFVL